MKDIFLLIKQSYYIVMSDSIKQSRLNRDAVGESETLFDFLKRKKQFNLENTVNKTFQNNSNTKRKLDYDLEEDIPQTRDLTKYRTYETNKIAQTARQNITPKKIEFDEPNSNNKSIGKNIAPVVALENQRKGRGFLSMISPIKQRSSSALEERSEQKQNTSQSKSGVKVGKSQLYSRKNVTKCINTIKNTVNNLKQNIKKIKEKSHGLAVLFNPIFNTRTDPNDPLIRQIGDMKNKLKSFEALIDGVNIENCDDLVANFHRNLEEHLQSQLHHHKREIEKSKDAEIENFRREKQVLIDKQQAEIKKITKENEILSRRLGVTEDNRKKFQESTSERELSYVQQLQRYKLNYEGTIQQLETRNAELQHRLQETQERTRDYEKHYKNERMLKQSLDNKYRDEIQQITQIKDSYLLNEIMVLKAEFNTDIARINQLHRIKEAELLGRIAKKDEEINRRILQKGSEKQIESKVLEQANLIKQQNMHLRNKSQCIVTDMYRMNQELYQHWMALKDIKLLSNRLGSFTQYRKIYDDLAFNDHLFH